MLALKSIQAFACSGFGVDVLITDSALYAASHELGRSFPSARRLLDQLPEDVQDSLRLHKINDIGSATSSGSYPVIGMVIVPCSMATLATVSQGIGDNGLRRAADVTIKEKRTLVIVPRETPFSAIHLENMLKLSRLGVTILPPIPAWYNRAKTLGEEEDFIVGKILDCFRVKHSLYPPWKAADEDCVVR